MQEYELAVLLHPDLEIDQAKPLAKIEKLVQTAEGKIVARDDWGKRKLAYPIKKQQFALYFFYLLELPSGSVGELERNLVISGEVLRHLLVKAPPVIEEAEEEPAEKAEQPASETETKATDKPESKAKAPAKATAAPIKEKEVSSPAKTLATSEKTSGDESTSD